MTMSTRFKVPLWLLTAIILSGCQSAAEHAASVQAGMDPTNRLTLGTVQREIRVGMSGANVTSVLGAPNMVTTDDKRREVWVYDRIGTDYAQSSSNGGIAVLLLGATNSAGAVSTTQRTLTVVIYFDESGKVRDFSYRSSSF